MPDSSSPLVCILMATYNGDPYIVEQIESIQAQTFTDWCLIVSDDGSTDGTLGTLRRMAEKDPRIVILEGLPPVGSAKNNFTRLAGYAKGSYVMFSDQDDVWEPNKIELTLDAMREIEGERGANTPALVFTDMEVVDQELRMIAPSFTRRSHINPKRKKLMQIVAQSLGAGCTMMANKSLIELFNGSPADRRIIMHDWWLSLLAAAFGVIVYVDKPTSKYRQHGLNSVGSSEFSPLKSAKNVDSMRDRVLVTMDQAVCFYDLFYGLLTDDDRRRLRAYVSIPSAPRLFIRMKMLIESRAWKGGLRKIGQIVAIARLGN